MCGSKLGPSWGRHTVMGGMFGLCQRTFFPLTFPAYSVSSCFKTRSLTQLLMTTHTMTFHPDTEHTHIHTHTGTGTRTDTRVYTHHCANSPNLILPHDYNVNMSACETLLHLCVCKCLVLIGDISQHLG